MTERSVRRLEASLGLLRLKSAVLADRFFMQLFAENPAFRPCYPLRVEEHKAMLVNGLEAVVQRLREPDSDQPVLHDLVNQCFAGARMPAALPVMRDTLIAVMSEALGTYWSQPLERDWREAIDLVCSKCADTSLSSAPPCTGGHCAMPDSAVIDPARTESPALQSNASPAALYHSLRQNRS